MTWLSGYSKRKAITLTGGASGAQTDFQLSLAVSYAAAMQGDFDDLRFTQSDGTTLIDAWAEVIVTDTSATVWVEFPTTPANTVESTYYMYYGNAGAASDWDIRATMLDGDDFPGSSLDGAIWGSQYCNIGVSGGILTLDTFLATGGRFGGGVLGKRLISSPFIVECKRKSVYASDGSHSGMSNYHDIRTDDSTYIDLVYNANIGGYHANEGSLSYVASGFSWSADTHYRLKSVHEGSQIRYYRDGSEFSGSPSSSNIPDEAMYMVIGGDATYSPTINADWIFVRKYAANPPTYEFGSEESESVTRMVYQGGFNTYKFNSVQVILEDVTANAMWYYNMLKRRNQ